MGASLERGDLGTGEGLERGGGFGDADVAQEEALMERQEAEHAQSAGGWCCIGTDVNQQQVGGLSC